ncbi:hypothetical protein EDC94DRAFT_645996 [Helicostylum pulchrum]|nr:hypothetical protein EDC94DRAFT_645996 [Helicostylum pulchrum]
MSVKTYTKIKKYLKILELKLRRADYALRTMSVTVWIPLKKFNAHLSLYNKFDPKNPLNLVNSSKLGKPASSTEIEIKKHFNLRTTRTKDRITAKERRSVKGSPKEAIPIMATVNAGTGAAHPRRSVLGTSRCLNPDCPAFKRGRVINNLCDNKSFIQTKLSYFFRTYYFFAPGHLKIINRSLHCCEVLMINYSVDIVT